MIWQDASLLWLLLLIPAAALLVAWWNRRMEQRLRRYFDDQLVARLHRNFWKFGLRLRTALILGALFLFTVGLAGPKIGTEVREVERRGLDMLVLLDLSRSMNAEDIRPNRLEKAKFEIARLIDRSPGDRIGLIVFTGQAFMQSPMTQDHAALRMFLDIAQTHQMPGGTTNFRSAFELAAETFNRLEVRGDAARVALLVSDGEDHGPSFSSALQSLTEQRVLVYSVGIGTTEGARIPVYDRDTGQMTGYHRDRLGQEVVTRLEPETLRQIARRGNGTYYEIRSTSAGIDAFLSHMDELQRGEYAVEEIADYRNRYQPLLLLGLALLLAGLALPEMRRNGTPPNRPET